MLNIALSTTFLRLFSASKMTSLTKCKKTLKSLWINLFYSNSIELMMLDSHFLYNKMPYILYPQTPFSGLGKRTDNTISCQNAIKILD